MTSTKLVAGTGPARASVASVTLLWFARTPPAGSRSPAEDGTFLEVRVECSLVRGTFSEFRVECSLVSGSFLEFTVECSMVSGTFLEFRVECPLVSAGLQDSGFGVRGIELAYR